MMDMMDPEVDREIKYVLIHIKYIILYPTSSHVIWV